MASGKALVIRQWDPKSAKGPVILPDPGSPAMFLAPGKGQIKLRTHLTIMKSK